MFVFVIEWLTVSDGCYIYCIAEMCTRPFSSGPRPDRDLEAWDRGRVRGVDNSSRGETETEAKAFRARDRDEAYQLRGETEPRHYCTLRRPGDRGIKTEATSLLYCITLTTNGCSPVNNLSSYGCDGLHVNRKKYQQYRIVLSELPETTRRSRYCKQAIPRLWPFRVRINSLVTVFHTLIVRSPDAETMYLSSKSTTLTAARWPTRTRRNVMSIADCMSHTAIERSYTQSQIKQSVNQSINQSINHKASLHNAVSCGKSDA